MFAPVWERVVRGAYRSTPATLAGHARFALLGETYPGVVVAAGSSVAGRVYFDVVPDDLAALDRFEGIEYRRVSVPVQLADGTTLAAAIYLFDAVERLSQASWDPAEFRMQEFLDSYCRDKLD